jgi:hypothetical protein
MQVGLNTFTDIKDQNVICNEGSLDEKVVKFNFFCIWYLSLHTCRKVRIVLSVPFLY